MKKYNICNLLYNDPIPTPPALPVVDFDITTTDDDGNSVNLITNAEFRILLFQKYFSFYLLTPSFYDTEGEQHVELVPDVSAAIIYLGNIFGTWTASRVHGFLKLYEALNAEYKPWVNYDKHIDSTMEYTGKEKNELEKSGSEQLQMQKGEDTTIISKTPYDSSTFYDNTKNVNQLHTDTDTTSFTNRKDTAEKSFTNRKDIYNYTEYGNIGVKSTQEIILTSFNLCNLEDLKNYIVNMFVHENLIL